MRSWPHAPSKVVVHPGAYIVTAATYRKEKLFDSDAKLDLLHDLMLEIASDLGWELQAWAVFANHYHFVGHSPPSEKAVWDLTRRLHGRSAIQLNKLDGTPKRTVWYRSWDTRLTFEKSYLARLTYVHNNAVRHGLAREATAYPWCSARWFERLADKPFFDSVMAFNTDSVKVYDDF